MAKYMNRMMTCNKWVSFLLEFLEAKCKMLVILNRVIELKYKIPWISKNAFFVLSLVIGLELKKHLN